MEIVSRVMINVWTVGDWIFDSGGSINAVWIKGWQSTNPQWLGLAATTISEIEEAVVGFRGFSNFTGLLG